MKKESFAQALLLATALMHPSSLLAQGDGQLEAVLTERVQNASEYMVWAKKGWQFGTVSSTQLADIRNRYLEAELALIRLKSGSIDEVCNKHLAKFREYENESVERQTAGLATALEPLLMKDARLVAQQRCITQ